MICTFCGAENRPENKFCGLCGVRLEQRKAERRLRQDATHLKCASCGHINEPGYKFCGMCGSRIERRIGERRRNGSPRVRATAAANLGLPGPDVPARSHSEQPPPSRYRAAATEVLPHPERPASVFRTDHAERGIRGPSFLGLSDEPESEGGYLLEDEGTSRRGLRTVVLLAILAAIFGLVVVQWRSGFFKANPKAPETPKAEPAQRPQGMGQAPAPAPSASPDQSARSNQAEVQYGFADNGKQILSQAFGNKEEQGPAAAAKHSAAKDTAAEKTAEDEGSLGGAGDASHKPSSMLLKAQQYLQGSGGVRQNCEQGLIYLRAAAQKNEPAAAVQMAALYSSGHCVQQDRVMAWRWFSSAHELEPENQLIKRNMDQIWAQMTDQERRQTAR